jgi:hypothetical protein
MEAKVASFPVVDWGRDPITCFKYRTAKAALECLSRGTLWFARPDSLNDSLETRFDSADPSMYTQTMEDTFNEIYVRQGLHPRAKFDAQSVQGKTLLDEIAKDDKRLQEWVTQVGIFSAGSRPDQQAMWAYYANEGSGFCFELSWTLELLAKAGIVPRPVYYSSGPRIFNRADDWRDTFLEFATMMPHLTVEELEHLSRQEHFAELLLLRTGPRAVSTKNTDWEHESELRLIAPQAGAVEVVQQVLKRVYYVERQGSPSSEVMAVLRDKYPGVEVVKLRIQHHAVTRHAPQEPGQSDAS